MRKLNASNDHEGDNGFIITAVIVTVVIIGLWTTTYFLLKDLNELKRGTFGDMFGSVNALFSGLALAGIILTILLQRKELKLQREELRDTRAEFEIQNETLKLQRFENTFFNLLNLHHQIVSAIDYRYYKSKEKERGWGTGSFMTTKPEEKEAVTITGRDVFRHRYNLMLPKLKEQSDSYEEIYLEHYEQAQTDFGHYFRNLYRMIKLVDQTDFFYNSEKVTKEEIFKIKYRYTSIIRSQISDYELLWIFYNCLSENGIDKFKPFIERYSFFKNIPVNLIADKIHVNLYEKRAFIPDEQ
ncbi:hypothetical protein KACHI17_11710 [Sediminibacterium sp. KACHI17]|uniref:Phage abortive infection protein n=1 Tax=Sediminibacterium sp. KACHI17 TaxID=1751071 RepID=A0AAT9GIF2_9BACT